MKNIIYVINGPNLNLLGKREPSIYGLETLDDIELACKTIAIKLGFEIRFLQSNAEHHLVNWINEACEDACGIVINLAAYTHTSIASLDALKIFEGPIIEVHISNLYRRELFRHHSYISSVASGVIIGCGIQGYIFGIERIAMLISNKNI
ncbi:3-dehydroquinate dehydratase [Liberibacter crescens]|nr:3-dehydroquinate dehydratase [Liberibacter crescens]